MIAEAQQIIRGCSRPCEAGSRVDGAARCLLDSCTSCGSSMCPDTPGSRYPRNRRPLWCSRTDRGVRVQWWVCNSAWKCTCQDTVSSDNRRAFLCNRILQAARRSHCTCWAQDTFHRSPCSFVEAALARPLQENKNRIQGDLPDEKGD